jgi:hypothetical protein
MCEQIPATDGYMKLRALNKKTGKIGKPTGASGYVVAYEIADVAPDDESGYTNREYVSGSTFSKKFPKKIRGKKVQVCLYWVNTEGKQGPWSPNIEIIIP